MVEATKLPKERDDMEACAAKKFSLPPDGDEPAPEIARWLCVSGDLDDLIYFDEDAKNSER